MSSERYLSHLGHPEILPTAPEIHYLKLRFITLHHGHLRPSLIPTPPLSPLLIHSCPISIPLSVSSSSIASSSLPSILSSFESSTNFGREFLFVVFGHQYAQHETRAGTFQKKVFVRGVVLRIEENVSLSSGSSSSSNLNLNTPVARGIEIFTEEVQVSSRTLQQTPGFGEFQEEEEGEEQEEQEERKGVNVGVSFIPYVILRVIVPKAFRQSADTEEDEAHADAGQVFLSVPMIVTSTHTENEHGSGTPEHVSEAEAEAVGINKAVEFLRQFEKDASQIAEKLGIAEVAAPTGTRAVPVVEKDLTEGVDVDSVAGLLLEESVGKIVAEARSTGELPSEESVMRLVEVLLNRKLGVSGVSVAVDGFTKDTGDNLSMSFNLTASSLSQSQSRVGFGVDKSASAIAPFESPIARINKSRSIKQKNLLALSPRAFRKREAATSLLQSAPRQKESRPRFFADALLTELTMSPSQVNLYIVQISLPELSSRWDLLSPDVLLDCLRAVLCYLDARIVKSESEAVAEAESSSDVGGRRLEGVIDEAMLLGVLGPVIEVLKTTHAPEGSLRWDEEEEGERRSPEERIPPLPSGRHTKEIEKIMADLGLVRELSNELRRLILDAVFGFGRDTVRFLLRKIDGDSFALSALANHPSVLRSVVLPALMRGCQETAMKRRWCAVEALARCSRLAGEAGALGALIVLLRDGLLDRRVVATAIRAMGPEGEKVLCGALGASFNVRVRVCAAYSFAQAVEPTRSLLVMVKVDPTTSVFFSRRRVVWEYVPDSGVLLFDGRELMVQLRRVLTRLDQTGEALFGSSDEEAYVWPEDLVSAFRIVSRCDLTRIVAPASLTEGVTSQRISVPRARLVSCGIGASQSDESDQSRSHSDDESNSIQFYEEEEVYSALCDALHDKDEKVRFEVAKTMSRLAHPSFAAALIQHTADESILVRTEAIVALGNLGKDLRSAKLIFRAIRHLMPLLSDRMYNVRYCVVQTLRVFGPLAKGSSLIPSVVRALMRPFTDGTINRDEVARTLVSLREPGVDPLLAIVSKETHFHSKLRMSAAYGMRFLDILEGQDLLLDRVVETLFNSAQDRIPNVRKMILQSLTILSKRCHTQPFLRSTSILPFLFSYLKDRDESVRFAAAKDLSSLGQAGLHVIVDSLSKNPSELVRQSCAYGCGLCGPVAFADLISVLARENNALVKKEMFRSLEKMGGPAIEKFILAKKSKSAVKHFVDVLGQVVERAQHRILFKLRKRLVLRI